MSFSLTLVDLAGFIALLLWGTHMVQTGIQRAFGPKLRNILGMALRSRGRAFLAGVGVTAALQSSTATGLMIAGFAGAGLVELMPGLAVMLGANVGTTLIVQMLSFDVAAFSPVLILVGVLMFRRDSSPQTHDLGRVFIGLGLMLLALHHLLVMLTPFEDVPSLRLLLGAISTQPLLAILLAAGVTWAVHSSVAVVLLIMSLASKGVVPPNAAFALVLGANLGTALNPILEGGSADDPAAKRLPIGNFLTRLVGVAIALALLPSIGVAMVTIVPDDARSVANFHLLFNLALAGLFLPVLTPYAALLTRMLPARVDPADPSRPLYLDPAARETPIVALGAAAREALRLADGLETMLDGAREALLDGQRKRIGTTRRFDDVLDRLNTAIKAYLTSIDPDELNEDDHRRLEEILIFSTNMEHAGDVLANSLLPHASKRLKRGLSFTPQERAELQLMFDRLIGNLRTAASLLMTNDLRTARLLAEEKAVFRDTEQAATRAHVDQLRSQRREIAETSAMHLDLLRDIKLVNGYIVAAAAYPVLERTGQLLPSRIGNLS